LHCHHFEHDEAVRAKLQSGDAFDTGAACEVLLSNLAGDETRESLESGWSHEQSEDWVVLVLAYNSHVLAGRDVGVRPLVSGFPLHADGDHHVWLRSAPVFPCCGCGCGCGPPLVFVLFRVSLTYPYPSSLSFSDGGVSCWCMVSVFQELVVRQ
jgi:hypothetical protein